MRVMLTLHHFVWPLWLERDRGGMIGRGFPDLFTRYADRVAGGLRHALRRFARWFPDQELFIVENGCPPEAGGMTRADYMDAHLREVEAALAEGLRVRGYNWWSIPSNREWGHAFDPNTDFGLYFVDLDNDPALRRVKSPVAEHFRAWTHPR
jgi:beta-glucosidase/6-phospho-beta-glucosidase/beta-galactosidase